MKFLEILWESIKAGFLITLFILGLGLVFAGCIFLLQTYLHPIIVFTIATFLTIVICCLFVKICLE